MKENYSLKNREKHIRYVDLVKPENVTVKPKNDAVNDTVFSLMKQNESITAIEISEKLNISLRTVRRKIKDLKDKGLIKRIGSNKTGHWKIIEK